MTEANVEAGKDNFVRTTHGFSESSVTGAPRKHHFSVQPDRSARPDLKDGTNSRKKVLPSKIVRRVDRT